MNKKIRDYEYKGRVVGAIWEKIDPETRFRIRYFVPELEEFEAIDLVREMDLEDKIHMKHNAYGVFRLLEYYRMNPDDYVEDEDIVIYVADNGYKTLTELNHKDIRAWQLVHQRGLEGKLFPELQPVDEV